MVILQSELGYSTTGGPKPALYILLLSASDLVQRSHMGTSINDVTQFWSKIDPLTPLSHFVTNLGPPGPTEITSQACNPPFKRHIYIYAPFRRPIYYASSVNNSREIS